MASLKEDPSSSGIDLNNKILQAIQSKLECHINLEYKCESHNATFATINKENFDLMFEKFEARRINDLSEFLSTMPFFKS
jgi:hypothetical protein